MLYYSRQIILLLLILDLKQFIACSKIGKSLRLTKNETYDIEFQSLLIPTNKSDFSELELQTYLNETNFSNLLVEKQKFNIEQQIDKIFTFISDNKQSIDVYFMIQNQLQRQFQVENYLVDEEIQIVKTESLPIKLDYGDCDQLHKIVDEIFIIKCTINLTTTQFSIIDHQGLVLDQLQYITREECQIASEYFLEKLLYYEKKCLNPQIILVNIMLGNFTFDPLLQYITIKNNGVNKLRNIYYCSPNLINLNFYDQLIKYDFIQKLILYVSQQVNQITLFRECQQEISLTDQNDFENYWHINIDNPIEDIQDYFIINKNIVLLMKNQINIINNSHIKIRTTKEFNQITKLGQLPYIISNQMNNNIIIYKVNTLEDNFKYSNSKYILAITIDFYRLQFSTVTLYEIELYDLTQPKLIYEKEVHITSDLNQNNIYFSEISQSLPIEVNIFKDDDHVIQEIKQFFEIKCEIDQSILEQNVFILRMNESNYVAVQIERGLISIFNCKQTMPKKFQYNYTQSTENIFISSILPQFVIQNSQQLLAFKINENYDVVQLFTFQFTSQISQTKQQLNSVYFLFTNCTFTKFSLLQFSFEYFYENSFSNCTNTKSITNHEIYIDQNQIIFIIPNGKIYKKWIRQNILAAEIQQQSLLIFQLINQQICIDLYVFSSHKKNLTFIYQLPTYHFTVLTLNYSFQYPYLVVIGSGQNELNYLLVYDVSKQAVNSLVQVIPINGLKRFFLYEINQKPMILLIQKGKITSCPLVHFTLMFFSNQTYDQYFKTSEVVINITSPIMSQNEISKIHFHYQNLNQQLRFRLNSKNKQLIINNRFQVMNLGDIFGFIQKIEGLNSEKIKILPPLNFEASSNQSCNYYYQNTFCLFKQQLVYDCFGKKLIIFENLSINIIAIEKIQNQINIFYKNQENQTNFIENQLIIQEFQVNFYCNQQEFLDLTRCLKVQKNMFLFDAKNSKQIYYFDQNQQLFHLLQINGRSSQDQLDIIEIDQYFLIISMLNGKLKFLKIKEKAILDSQVSYEGNIHCTEIQGNINIELIIKDFSIISHNLMGQFVQIDLLLLFLLKPYGYIFRIEIDFEKNLILDSFIFNYIRPGPNAYFIRFLFVSNDTLIIQPYSEKNSNLMLYYDILQRKINEIIDPISLFEYENLKSIEEYNSTYLVFISVDNFIQLVQKGLYQLVCEDKCSKVELLLKNQVSELRVSVFSQNVSKINLENFIIPINCFFIILILVLKRKPEKRKEMMQKIDQQ